MRKSPGIGKKICNIHYVFFIILSFIFFYYQCYSQASEQKRPRPDNFFNVLFTRYEGGWTGGDGTYSVPLPDGRNLWLFGDSFVDPVNPDRTRPSNSRLVHNSFVIQKGEKIFPLPGGTSESPSAFISPEDKNRWYWPFHGVIEKNRLYVFLAQYERTGDKPWDFRYQGTTDVGIFSLPELKLLSKKPLQFDSLITFGTWILEDGRYTYIYGVENVNSTKFAIVARSEKENLLSQWTYYDGYKWSKNFHTRAHILKGVSSQFSVIRLKGRYYFITQQDRFGEKIMCYESKSLHGPWINAKVLYITPEKRGSIYTYNALAHPQFTRNNELLISYNVNSLNIQDIFRDADNYRPRFIRVPGF